MKSLGFSALALMGLFAASSALADPGPAGGSPVAVAPIVNGRAVSPACAPASKTHGGMGNAGIQDNSRTQKPHPVNPAAVPTSKGKGSVPACVAGIQDNSRPK